MTYAPRILLIQARTDDDLMRVHELEAFCRATGLVRENFRVFNIAIDAFSSFSLAGVDAAMVGGAGAFSLVDSGFGWHQDFLDVTLRLVTSGIPTFGSCFGFQALIQAFGGKLARDPARSELGTFEVSLTSEGVDDLLFGRLPAHFDAQFGHNDSAITLPEELVHLARSERCLYQAVRAKGSAFVATQFHPELNMDGNLDRFRNYLNHYKQPEHDFEQAMAHARTIHRPSPDSSALLRCFVEDVAAGLRLVEIG
ncbi:MAG: type 1 glutamine amidotransferase [Bradymonadaceae bacterium]|nr:type 1 glutamine amidotransferase [Lujinxingiaceae bacterium]